VFTKLTKLIRNPRQVILNRIPKKPLPPLQVRIWDDLINSLEPALKINKIAPVNTQPSAYLKAVDLVKLFVDSDLRELFIANRTDKDKNGYSEIYSTLLYPVRNKNFQLVEVGIGTNNPNLPSNMGMTGVPGASLRAFSEYLGAEAKLIGLDVDSSILFETEMIKTLYVNQLERGTFSHINSVLTKNQGADLIIDDGLHRPVSCINTFLELLPHLRIGGYYIIEDQDPSLHKYWEYICAQLSHVYTSKILYTKPDIIIILVTRTE
jgi:hypothetical protein